MMSLFRKFFIFEELPRGKMNKKLGEREKNEEKSRIMKERKMEKK